mmetsp:Transcript_9036/g.23636  ORF Transcript_9036/g.23636 Transcript_9036/m.23636 type:complete len:407 (-) Transcript_9036:1219-2439(-)
MRLISSEAEPPPGAPAPALPSMAAAPSPSTPLFCKSSAAACTASRQACSTRTPARWCADRREAACWGSCATKSPLGPQMMVCQLASKSSKLRNRICSAATRADTRAGPASWRQSHFSLAVAAASSREASKASTSRETSAALATTRCCAATPVFRVSHFASSLTRSSEVRETPFRTFSSALASSRVTVFADARCSSTARSLPKSSSRSASSARTLSVASDCFVRMASSSPRRPSEPARSRSCKPCSTVAHSCEAWPNASVRSWPCIRKAFKDSDVHDNRGSGALAVWLGLLEPPSADRDDDLGDVLIVATRARKSFKFRMHRACSSTEARPCDHRAVESAASAAALPPRPGRGSATGTASSRATSITSSLAAARYSQAPMASAPTTTSSAGAMELALAPGRSHATLT